MTGEEASVRRADVRGLDHISLPLGNADAVAAFYRTLGFAVTETDYLVQVQVGSQMLNLHRPSTWQASGFMLRGPAAAPGCGDLCLVWGDTVDALLQWLAAADVPVEEGPVRRVGGQGVEGESVYVRDPDRNLLELIVYPVQA